MAAAQSFTATNNASLFPASSELELAVKPDKASMTSIVKVEPLTGDAGQGMSQSQLGGIYLQGELILTSGSNANALSSSQIAYISCDSDFYSGFMGAWEIFETAISREPAAVVLFSTEDDYCSYSGSGVPYTIIYSMTAANASADLLNVLNSSSDNTAVIALNSGSGNSSSNSSSTSNDGSVLGPSPTTAVAMIILYSVTGLITALFLSIIITGAIRAHRHPERYGPRNLAGRPRQSRAKGIARAMLETLPIVKFGDHQDVKPGEVELGSVGSQNASSSDHGAAGTGRTSTSADRQEDVTEHSAGDARDVGSERNVAAASNNDEAIASAEPIQAGTTEPHPHNDEGLGCAICTEEFEKGEDLRVLPCNHKYHPACIDPWLLNVSGTCPLCRVDLRPSPSNASGAVEESSEALPPPLTEGEVGPGAGNNSAEAEGSNARSRRHRSINPLHMLRLRTAEDRLAMARDMRDEHTANAGTAPMEGTVEERNRRGRVRSFFSEVAAMSRGPPGAMGVEDRDSLPVHRPE